MYNISMLPVRIAIQTIPLLWEKLPRYTLPALTLLGSAFIACRVSSNYKIRAALILTTGVLFYLAKRIHEHFRINEHFPSEVAERIPTPYVPPRQRFDFPPKQKQPLNDQYLNLLPFDLLAKIACLQNYEQRQEILADAATESWQVHYKRGCQYGTEEDELIALRALASEGIVFYPEFGESAVEHLHRHQSLIKPDSPLLGAHRLQLQSRMLPIRGKISSVIGPLLLTLEGKNTVATHWPTGQILWSQPSRENSTDDYFFKAMTGERLNGKAENVSIHRFVQIEKLSPKKLFNHTTNEEIHLSEDCQEVLLYNPPYLLFTNEKGVWIKNGNAPEILTEATEPQRNWRCKPPYFVTHIGVFSFETGKRVLQFMKPCSPDRVWIKQNPLEGQGTQVHYFISNPNGTSSEITVNISSNSEPAVQDNPFPLIAESVVEGRVKLKNTRFEIKNNYAMQGSLLVNYNGMLNFYDANNHSSSGIWHFVDAPPEFTPFANKHRFQQFLALYNSYALILVATKDQIGFQVVDLTRAKPDQP